MIYNLKLLWWERDRVGRAYRHYRKYGAHYRYDSGLARLFNAQRNIFERTSLGRAISYTLNNPRSFDSSYFPDMEKAFNREATK